MKNNATAFSKWIYLLQHREQIDRAEETMAEGILLEEDLHRIKSRESLFNKTVGYIPNYKLIYNGSSTGTDDAFKASELVIFGCPLLCKPDLIFENANGNITIIENKYSKRGKLLRPLPANGWLNNRGQLWCYSKIDDFRDRTVSLVLQFWHYNVSKVPIITSRKEWSRCDFEDFTDQFNQYKLECEQAASSNR